MPQRPVNAAINFAVSVNDPDDADYVFQLDLESSVIPAGAAQPTIDPTSGAFRWTPSTTGRFELRIIVVNGNGWANQQTFLIDIVSA